MPAGVTGDGLVTGFRGTCHPCGDTGDASPQDHSATVHLGHGVILGEPVTKIARVTQVTQIPIYSRTRERVHTRKGGEHRGARHRVIPVTRGRGDRP